MAASQHTTLVGLSLLVLAMTELTAPAWCFHLRGEESYSDPDSQYSEALEKDIGSTLHLLDFLLSERNGGAQQDQTELKSVPRGEGEEELSKMAASPDALGLDSESLSGLNQETSRADAMSALLRRLQVKTLLKLIVNSSGKDADDINGAADESGLIGFESLLSRAPASSSAAAAAAASAKIDDVIPSSTIKSKRGRHENFGAMPPAYEFCRRMRINCF